MLASVHRGWEILGGWWEGQARVEEALTVVKSNSYSKCIERNGPSEGGEGTTAKVTG